MHHCHSAFGLVIRSELSLPELVAADEAAAPDVEVRWASLPPREEGRTGYSAGAEGTFLDVPEAGRFLIREGREILIDPAPGASERNIRLYLLGSAFGALLHQRGLVPLHANAIAVDGRAVAFSGHSGAGKSTIAAWFHDRGYRILADDVCVIRFDELGQPLAYPGIPRLRLWREALEAGGRVADDYARSFDDVDKYDVPTRAETAAEPLPLSRIYMLTKSEAGSEAPLLQRIFGMEAVNALVSNTYRGGYVKTIGKTGDHLMQCLRIARAVPVFEARRRWGFDVLDDEARTLERHARGG